MKEEFTVPTDGFLCEWESVGISILAEIVGKKLGCRRSRWYRFASVDSVSARVEEKLLDCWRESLEAG